MSGHAKTLLAAGGAPSCWQRQIARNTARLDALRRACAWVEEITAVQIKLCDKPLLGRSLAMLTTQINRQAKTEHDTSRQARWRATRAMASSKREHEIDSNTVKRPRKLEPSFPGETQPDQTRRGTARQSHHTDRIAPHRLTQIDRQVDHTVLQRLAGETMPVHGTDRPRHHPAVSFSKGQQGRSPVMQQILTQQRTVSLRSWEDTLIKQARHVLRNAYQSAATRTELEEVLPQQWRSPIEGPTAPLELLLSLTSLFQQKSSVTVSNERDSSMSFPAQESRAQEKLATVGSTEELMQPRSSHAQLSLFDGANDINQVVEEHLPASAQAERVMPPAVVPQLPLLTSSQRVDIPPLPVATATVKLGARAEMIIEDDLDMLAAKIKRILDDEARRHGIDV